MTLDGPSGKRYRVRGPRRSITRKSRVPRLMSQNRVHTFARKMSFTLALNNSNGWTQGATTSQSLQFNFALNGVTGYISAVPLATAAMVSADFTNLFDEYKITGIKMNLFTGFDTTTLSAAPNLPVLHIVKDYDDVTALVSVAAAMQYQNCRSISMGASPPPGGVSVFLRPKVQIQTYRTALTTGYSPKAGQWIDNEQVDVPHYGLKMWVDTMVGSNSALGSVVFVFTYYIKCRCVK